MSWLSDLVDRGTKTAAGLVDSTGAAISALNPLPVGARRLTIVPISGPAPANGAAFVQFTAFTPQTWTSADIDVSSLTELRIIFDVVTQSAGSSQLALDVKQADGNYRQVFAAVAKTGAATDIVSLGAGFDRSGTLGTATGISDWARPVELGDIIRIRIIVGTGNLTGTLEIKGK